MTGWKHDYAKLSEVTLHYVTAGTYARAVEDANDRALRSSQMWTDGATRFLKDYVAESQDAAAATERVFATAFSSAEDSLLGFIATASWSSRASPTASSPTSRA